ncbi:MAG: hypothetical protein FWC82_01765 [Firmicutes bacterium]|nr:hypothetical protein [Bacillota bacterium]
MQKKRVFRGKIFRPIFIFFLFWAGIPLVLTVIAVIGGQFLDNWIIFTILYPMFLVPGIVVLSLQTAFWIKRIIIIKDEDMEFTLLDGAFQFSIRDLWDENNLSKAMGGSAYPPLRKIERQKISLPEIIAVRYGIASLIPSAQSNQRVRTVEVILFQDRKRKIHMIDITGYKSKAKNDIKNFIQGYKLYET